MTRRRPSPSTRRGIASVHWLQLCAVAVLAGCAAPPRSPPAGVIPHGQARPEPPGPVAPSAPLTAEAAIRRALAVSPRIAALQASVTVARQRRRAATDITDPELQFSWADGATDEVRRRASIQEPHTSSSSADQTASGPDSVLSQDGQNEQTSTIGNTTENADEGRLGVRLFVPNPWLVMPRIAAGDAEIEAARSDLRNAEWQLACDVRRLVAEIGYGSNRVALAQELVDLDGVVLKTVRSRADQGAATAAALLAATRRHLQLAGKLDQVRQENRLAHRELAALLNVPPEALRVDAASLVPPPASAPDSSSARLDQIAAQRRADVTALHWRVLAARCAYREARNVRYPWIKEIVAGYRSGDSSTTGADYSSRISRGSVTGSGSWIADESDTTEWQVGVVIDVPVFSWLHNHADAARLAECGLAEALETEGIRLVESQVRDALDEMAESRRQAAEYGEKMHPLLAEMQATLKLLEGSPSVMPDETAEARMQVLEVRGIKLESERRLALAWIALERAVGMSLADLTR